MPTSCRRCSRAPRTEELRALAWSHVDLDGEPPSVQLWRSVREGGDTKTRLSRRTLELPERGAKAMDDIFNAHREANEPPTLPPRPMRTNRSLK